MIRKLLEAFFRHKVLVMAPAIVIPLVVGPISLFTAPTYYEAWAGVWVERSVYLEVNEGWNSYLSPAQNQTTRLTELLRTRTFMMDVARRTSLAPLIGDQRGEERIAEIIGRGLAARPNGNNLILLRFQGPTPELTFQVTTAVLEAFKEKASNDRVSQASVAIAFYEGRLKTAEEQYAKSNEALRRYVAANPRLTSIDPNGGAASTAAARLGLPAAAIDPQIAELLRKAELDKVDVERARQAVQQATLQASAGLEGQELGFQVVDAPKTPTRPTQERRKLLIFPVAGLLVGLGLSGTLLVLLVASDRSVRTAADLEPDTRILGSLPRLEFKKVDRKKHPQTARRAMGSVAGAALPAPPGAK